MSEADNASNRRRPMVGLVLGAMALGAFTACKREPPPPPPPFDAGPPRDAGSIDARVFPRRDAGPLGPIVDGVVDDDEWADAVLAENTVDTDEPGSALERLRAVVVDGRLFVAVEGTVADGGALLVYVDGELGGADGVSDFADLTDEDGVLDGRLSRSFALPVGFAADAALGTTLMPRTTVGLDDGSGWRDIGTDPTEFRWLPGETAPLVCSATACEASIELGELPGEVPRELAVFARLESAAGVLTNQTLPEDDPADPATVGVVLTVNDGEPPPPDAGVPLDGGVDDAGTGSGPTIDGVVGVTEWAGALLETNARTADGTSFAGNALRTLRVLRDSERLYVAIEGELFGDSAILMYVDADVASGSGIMNASELVDGVGALDNSLSFRNIILHPELRVDFAWGTLDMSRAAAGIDDRMGWRDVATNPAAFIPVSSASAPTVCSATACETSIRLADLGARAAGSVGVFVRLGSTRLAILSNQTLPFDLDAESVTVFAEALP